MRKKWRELLNHLYYAEYLRIEIDKVRDGEGGEGDRERER